MKKILFFLTLFLSTTTISHAQERFIARGATPGELYISADWYEKYYSEEAPRMVSRLTQNGKKLTIQYYANQYNNTSDVMLPGFVIADATSGVIYQKGIMGDERFWVSFDYGQSWIYRESYGYPTSYYGSNVTGLIYRGGWLGWFYSINFGESFEIFMPPKGGIIEPGMDSCESFGIGRIDNVYKLAYTNDCGQFVIRIPIDEQYVYSHGDVYRGTQSGEVYISSKFPDESFKVSFSTDTGHTFKVVYHSADYNYQYDDNEYFKAYLFMSDRESGVFYIVRFALHEHSQPIYGEHLHIYVDYYRDYGETLVATYCHDLHKNYGKTCEAVNDLAAEKCSNNCVLLSWSDPESSLPIVEYHVYRKGEGRKEKGNSPPMYWRGGREADGVVLEYELVGIITGTTFLDENLPVGEYEYYVVALYEMGCVADSSNHVKIEIEVGIDEYLQPNYTIIPNPATNQITISSATSFHSIEIINFLGQTVVSLSSISNTATVNVSNLNNGVYFVRVGFENGGNVRKLVKM